MRRIFFAAFALALLAAPAALHAQFKPEDEKAGGIKFDKEQVQRIRIGMTIRAVGGPCGGLHSTIPLPMDWPEQKVVVIAEEFSPSVKRGRDRSVDGTVKQMVVSIPQLKSGDEAKALLTLEVHRRAILPPADTSVFSIPTKEQLDTALKAYLAASPKIETNSRQIVDVAKKIMADSKEKDAWGQVEAIYDWVRENVEYRNQPLKGALAALKDKNGDCEEMTSLFIALCRVNGIPARTVWVPGHCYPEFYLIDRQGAGHWFPCQAAGSRAFGGIPETRPILQKGDSFKDPDRPREKMRYLSEFLSGKKIKGGGEPHVTFLRQDVATDKSLDDPSTDIAPIKSPDEKTGDKPADKPAGELGDMPPGDNPGEAQPNPEGVRPPKKTPGARPLPPGARPPLPRPEGLPARPTRPATPNPQRPK